MRLTEFLNNLRVELGDLDEDNPKWTDDELRRTIDSAIHDLDRFIPQTKTYEVTVKPTVTGEAWTSAAAHGTYVQLANVMIKPASESVTNVAGTITYTRDTDYTIDYSNGKITTISGGTMAVDTAYRISYTKSKLAIDLGSITDLIRVVTVEYPMGNVPQTTVGFQTVGNILFLQTMVSTTTRSQTEMSEGEHVAVHYEAINVGPSESSEPSFPRHLDEVVIRGAIAKSMFILSIKQSGLGSEDMESARDQIEDIDTIMAAVDTALGNVGSHFTDAASALANIPTYQGYAKDQLDALPAQVTAAAAAMTSAAALADEGAASFDDADAHLNAVATILGNIDGKVANAETALGNVAACVADANDALARIMDEVPTIRSEISDLLGFWDETNIYNFIQLALTQLNAGAPLINKVNVGNDPADEYRQYGELEANIYQIAGNFITGTYTQGLGAYNTLLSTYVQEAARHVDRAGARVAEAQQRVALIDAYLANAARRIDAANGWISKATGIGNAARTYTEIAGQRVAIMQGYIQAALSYYQACDNYINTANAHIAMGQAYITQAQALLTEIQGKLGAANQFAQLAAQAIEVSKGLREEGTVRQSEYLLILRDRSQWIGDKVITSRNQPRG